MDMMIIVEPLAWEGIGAAILSGGLVGVERQIFGKPSGIRTCALVCLSVYIFVALSQIATGQVNADITRVLGQVITGVGFLGAGVIISKEGVVQGMTSAATIWMLAAIGSVIGFGHYTLGILLAFIVLFILLGINSLENIFAKILQRGVHRHFQIKGRRRHYPKKKSSATSDSKHQQRYD